MSKKNTLSLLYRSLNNFSFSKKTIEKNGMSTIFKEGLKSQKQTQEILSFSNQNFYMNMKSISTSNRFSFCTTEEKKKVPLKPQQIPQENLQVVATQEHVGQQDVEVFHTKGTLSILDKVPGVKHQQSGQLYVLMFTCTVCQTKSIRSFTKNAYHKGVVMVRCNGCDNVHLVSDNLGWFEDQPTNVQTMHAGKVKRVHDQGVINMFLKKAFDQQKNLFEQNHHHQHSQHCSHNHNHNHKNEESHHNPQTKKDPSTSTSTQKPKE